MVLILTGPHRHMAIVAYLIFLRGPDRRGPVTYQNDQNSNQRSDRRDDIRYTGWIIGGVVVLAIVIAAFIFTSTGRPW